MLVRGTLELLGFVYGETRLFGVWSVVSLGLGWCRHHWETHPAAVVTGQGRRWVSVLQEGALSNE